MSFVIKPPPQKSVLPSQMLETADDLAGMIVCIERLLARRDIGHEPFVVEAETFLGSARQTVANLATLAFWLNRGNGGGT